MTSQQRQNGAELKWGAAFPRPRSEGANWAKESERVEEWLECATTQNGRIMDTMGGQQNHPDIVVNFWPISFSDSSRTIPLEFLAQVFVPAFPMHNE